MSALHIPSTKVIVAASALALGIYALLKDNKSTHLIDNPELVARHVESKDHGVDNDDPEYDVVVIGGGTAGCAIAARLSQDPKVRVLVLEAGGSSHNVRVSRIPVTYSSIQRTPYSFNLWTEPQFGQRKYWPRGKLLGGCSAVNAMMFHTGAPTDYDEWALSGQEGASGWSHKEFLKYFLKFETFVPHPRYPNVDPSVRGHNGPVRVGFFGYLTETSSKWMEACVNLGIPFNPDVNTPIGTLGVTKVLTYIDSRGRRVNTENAYLTPEVLKRPNLKVAIHSNVTRILFDTRGGRKKAVGVEFTQHKDGPRYRVRAKRELVLSAGAVHSPHILMLSGVGPKKHLAEHGIPVVHDLPGVGQNLQDHAVVDATFRVKDGYSLSYLKATGGFDRLRALAALARWQIFGSGVMTSNPAEAAAFFRTDDPRVFPPDSYKIKDESSGSNAPDLESFIIPLGYTDHGHGPVPRGSLINMGAVLLRPQSSGTLSLRSADPFDPPVIDPKYLSSHNDVAALVRGLKLNLRLAQTEPLASIVVHDDDPALDHNTLKHSDAELEAEVHKRVQTLYHPTTTCRMARLEDGGVVDPFLRVYGIENLRVADASIFPRIPSGHTTAPSIAVGEKAADIIKEALSKAA